MKVSIREKSIKQGKEISLYLDVYLSTRERYREALGLKLIAKPTNAIERNINTETKRLAESIRSKRLLELQENKHGIHLQKKKKPTDFISFFEHLTAQRKKSGVNFHHWDSTLKQLILFTKATKRSPSLNEINVQWLEDFKMFLLAQLAQNTSISYFNKIKHALHDAQRAGLIHHNPADDVKSPAVMESKREFLTVEEVQSLIATPCKKEVCKKAFLFGCLTGLRISDLIKLTWGEMRYSEAMQWHIVYDQQKTKRREVLMVNQQAVDLLGEPQAAYERVFKGLKYNSWQNLIIQNWATDAGIRKAVTYHVARHTYATLQLTSGTDLYTVSKLLGHKRVETTQIYAKVVDEKKRAAADNLPILNFNTI